MILLLTAGTTLPVIGIDALVVFSVVLFALVLFIGEWFAIDASALIILLTLVLLEPWTGISPKDGVAGFSNPATITVLAMLILSEGVRKAGIVQIIGDLMASFAGQDRFKQLFSTITVSGLPSGFINNTPVVAMLVPVISDLARKGKNSPSKLLIPLSYASMFGGMVTLIGTSTNILASNISERLIGEAFSMFEFTQLGLLVFLVGSVYLLLLSDYLLPERVSSEETFREEFEMDQYLAEFEVSSAFSFIGASVEKLTDRYENDLEVLMIDREDEQFTEQISRKSLQANDRVIVRASFPTVKALFDLDGIIAGNSKNDGTNDDFVAEEPSESLVEVVIKSGSSLIGQKLGETEFLETYDADILAYRSGEEVVHNRFEEIELQPGDTLLIHTTDESLNRLSKEGDVIVTREAKDPDYKRSKIPYVITVMLGVVALPALGYLPILISSLLGVVAMVVGNVIQLSEIYDRVDWSVIVLLAGVIPLGTALENSGGADYLGTLISLSATAVPLLLVLWIFYMATGLLTNIISNNASVVLMIPVGVETAQQVGANPFAFILAVTFAASTAFMSPIGYQTNLFVYGPGGYKIRDYVKIGAPLQLLLSVVTVLGIAFIWGL